LRNADFVLSSAEDAAGSRLLLEHLLFVGIGVADLDEMFVTSRLGNGRVVEGLDNLLAYITRLKAGCSQ
jgi:hypothetical protein